ncbi:MAG: transposase [Rectinema subterraneum]
MQYCKARGIRLSGPKLGRPLSDIAKNQKQLREEQRIARQDERMRNAVEGKRRYSLDRSMTRLQATSESTIMMVFLVMNLGRLLRKTASAFFAPLVSLISRLLRAQNIVPNHAAQVA